MTAPTAQRLLAQHALEADPSVLNLSYALAAEGAFDGEAFGWALARLVEAYPSLGAPLPDRSDPFACVDVSECAASERARFIGALIARERGTPFDLRSPPLVRAVVVRLSERRHVLLLTFHHAVADSWMLSEYAAFISKAYAAVTAGAPLPVPAAQGAPAQRPVEARLAAERAALAANLAGLTRAQCDPFPATAPGALLRWSVALQEADAAVLQAAAVAQRVTRFALLSAVVADAVCALCDIEALLLGTTVLNRHCGADLAAGEARYQGAIFKASRAGAQSLRRTASAAAAAAERMMSYEEQLACASAIVGGNDGIAPAVFVMLDRHPMATLKLPDVDIRVVVPDGELSCAPRRAHSPRCGRIAFFWRDSPAGATLNLFAEEALANEAEQLLAAVRTSFVERANLVDRAKFGGFAPVPTEPWDDGLASVAIPAVDALSPVSFATPAHAEGRVS
jgi:hypothetical protein